MTHIYKYAEKVPASHGLAEPLEVEVGAGIVFAP